MAPKRIPELDGLRGVAIVLLMFYHCAYKQLAAYGATDLGPLLTLSSAGWCSVILFFVLSGFLIGGILVDGRNRPGALRSFYLRRACRILPLYLLLLGGYGVLRAALPSTARLFGHPMPWSVYATFTQNFWISAHRDWRIFGASMWSLAVEEQFYLVLPILVWLVPPARLFAVALAVAVTAAVAGPLAYLGGLVNSTQGYQLFRFDALMLGLLCALTVRRPAACAYLRAHARAATVFVGLGAIALTLLPWAKDLASGRWLFLGGFTAYALVFAGALLLAVIQSGHPLLGPLRSTLLTWLGSISYGLYLIHDVLAHAARELAADQLELRAWTAVAVLLSVAVAWLSWRLYESRMIRIGYRLTRQDGFGIKSSGPCRESACPVRPRPPVLSQRGGTMPGTRMR